MDFSNLKDKVLSALGQASDGAKDLAGRAGEGAKNLAGKAKDMGRVAKLNMEISTERENMRKAFSEIGRMYYETHKDAPEALFTQLCEEVALSEKNIADREAEISALKSSGEADVTVEFEEVVGQAEEAAEGCCEAAGEVRDAAEDCCCEAADKVKEAAEEIKDAAGDCCCRRDDAE